MEEEFSSIYQAKVWKPVDSEQALDSSSDFQDSFCILHVWYLI